MNKQDFILQLHQKLRSLGLDENLTSEKCRKISDNFAKIPEEQAAKHYTQANVDLVAAQIMKEINQQKEADSGRETTAIASGAPTQTMVNTSYNTHISGNDTVAVEKSTDKAATANKTTTSVMASNSSADNYEKHPKLLLAILALLCAPTILLLIAAVLGLSLGVAVAMAGIIIVVVVVIAAIVCGGSVLAVLSLIYGISQIISEPRYVGLHEIGLAMIFAGGTMFISIVLYNVAVRLIPELYRLIGKMLRALAGKIKVWFNAAKKGVEKL